MNNFWIKKIVISDVLSNDAFTQLLVWDAYNRIKVSSSIRSKLRNTHGRPPRISNICHIFKSINWWFKDDFACYVLVAFRIEMEQEIQIVIFYCLFEINWEIKLIYIVCICDSFPESTMSTTTQADWIFRIVRFLYFTSNDLTNV